MTGSEDPLRILRSRRGLAVTACLFLLSALSSAMTPLIPLLLTRIGHLEKGLLTLYFVVTLLVTLVYQPVAGYFSDGTAKWWWAVLLGGLGAAAGLAGLAVGAPLAWQLFFGVLATGVLVVYSQLYAVTRTRVAADWPAASLLQALTLQRSAVSLGFVVGTGTAGILLSLFDLRTETFLMASLLALVTLGAGALVAVLERGAARPQTTGTPTTPNGGAPEGGPLGLGWAALWGLAAVSLMHAADRLRFVYVPLVTESTFQDPRWGPLVLGVCALAELVTLPLLGWWAGRAGERRVIGAGALVGAASLAALALWPTVPTFLVSSGLFAFSQGALQGVALALIQSFLPRRPGLGTSLYYATAQVGGLAGVLLPLAVPGYTPLVFLLAAGLSLAASLLIVVPQTTSRSRGA